ncbi:MAG: hypothetical protein NTV89_02790, partial [Proteobacteria bacterium]|nr:hypothetical protein [Pseudomonadota bacterium]
FYSLSASFATLSFALTALFGFNATTIFLVACVTTPVAYVSGTGQADSRGFDTGECNGVWQERIRKAPAVPGD